MSGFGDDFVEAYVAECDEHLNAIRQALLALERSVGQARPDRRITEELFRSFHSLKGLAGMVEDRDAERLAHEMESYLRAVRDGDTRLTTEGIETLIDCTAALELTVNARRTASPPPDVSASLRALTTLTGDRLTSDAADPDADAPRTGDWECIFTPSSALIERGINVDTVRRRLREVGEIVTASPLITDQGVAFRFLVAGPLDRHLAETWQPDGMTVRTLEPSTGGAATTDAVLSDRSTHAAAQYVRVDLAKLDELMRMISDLVISRARLSETLARIESRVPAPEWRAVQENAVTLERQLRELREGVMRVRLVPVGEIFRRMPFVVRDLARETGRRINVELSGQDTEIDKFLVERMMDPVLHLVRNAVSHGLETVEERVGAGKPPDGTIELRASASGDLVRIEIADDGRGIDAERVLARAKQSGIPVPAQIDDAALLDLISSPGFSTRDGSDRASGRGVGMDVVRTTIEDLGGSVRMESAAGVGTRFTIDLPLTLAIADAFIARVGDDTFAIPQTAVREVIEVETAAIRLLEGSEVAPYRGLAIPVVRLSTVLKIAVSPAPRRHAFVVGVGAAAVALLVDRIIGQREIVVRATGDPLIEVDGVAGATDLGDGRAVLILDVHTLVRTTKLKEIA
jgi:two-component system, chemotaxis family, sensor kinase CheA